MKTTPQRKREKKVKGQFGNRNAAIGWNKKYFGEKKQVKAWAALITKNLAVSDRTQFGFPSDKIVPCTITYSLPTTIRSRNKR